MTQSRPIVSRLPRAGRLAVALALAMGVAALPAPAAAFNKTFSAGALIIPAQMEYQTDCGMTSAYGFIYSILYKNAALLAAGKKPVTVYWIIEPKKLSHHRCDVGTDALPDYSRYNDNDGCDAAIQNAAGQPVARLKVDNTEEAPFSIFTTSYDKAKGYSTRTSPTPATPMDASRKVAKYSGSFWVIDAVDRAAVVDMINTDPLVKSFRDGGKCASIPVATAGSHHTEVHVARIAFTAPVARQMNVKPPLIALLDAGAVTILQAYLKNAGLNDPVLLPNAGGTVTSHGVIYDTLDPVLDFVSTPTYPLGALNMPDPADATRTFYQVLWAPHWVVASQSTFPAAGAPGDDQLTVPGWTHYDPVTGTYDDPITNALKNIAAFGDNGNGIFAECASIESFEGSYKETGAECSGNYECQCTDASVCTVGDMLPLACDPGYTAACGACYQCAAGYTLDATSCGELKCVSTTPCDTGYTYGCGTCYQCGNPSYPNPDPTCVSSPRCWNSTYTRNRLPTSTSVPTTAAAVSVPAICSSAGYVPSCVPATPSIDVPGNPVTRFQVTNLLDKNGLGNSFAGPDCTDDEVAELDVYPGLKYGNTSTITGDCLDFHPTTGGPASIFSQKGNFNYTGTSGHIHQYRPPSVVSSLYKTGVLLFATSRNQSIVDRNGWDFTSARHKDNDPAKGMVVYLAGHSYANDVAGNRIVLNTMLNLGFSDAGIEVARSEPVGYVTRTLDPSTGMVTAETATVFQGTYIQRMPPGPFQDWLNYNPALPQSWRFPYIDGHLRAYDASKVSTSKQDFRTNALWDASLPAPTARTIFTALGGAGNLGWKPVEVKYSQTSPATCTNADGNKDANGLALCDLSEALAACGTAGVTTGTLRAGDASGSKEKLLGMFVQQVRGHCSAHVKATGAPIYEPTTAQCDDLKQQKNVAKLGGVDHSSPAIVGPSAYIWDSVDPIDKTMNKWSQRPVVAYVGARDGMLHAFYVAGDTSWTAQGAKLPAGTVAGKELWAFLPPGQLCGLATNGAMVDATVNVIDVFGDFPTDYNRDGVFDLTKAEERPDGVREWRTVLLVAAGEGGGELFAMDVTNPLRPALLWHVEGKKQTGKEWDANKDGDFADATDVLDTGNPFTYALKWFDWDDGDASTTHIPTQFGAESAADLARIKTGRYDYRNLGITFGTTVGTLWEGNAFWYVAYVATNTADWTDATPLGFKGIEFFAIDLVTGAKKWQWEHRYGRARSDGTVIADNVAPGRPALVDENGDGSVDKVYAGDIEGHLWELDATTGANVNYLNSTDGKKRSYPLFGTGDMAGTGADVAITNLFKPASSTTLAQQPLTSPIGIGRLTSVPAALSPYLQGRVAVAQGTMGVDWAIAPFEAGHVYVVPVAPTSGTRAQAPINAAGSDKPLLYGILDPKADWDIVLKVGERIFGMPKIVGNDIFVNTSYGSFTGDISETYLEAGSTYKINSSTAGEVMAAGKAFGGALILGNDVIISSASGLERKQDAAKPPGDGQHDTQVHDRSTPAIFNTWEQRGDATPAYLNP